MRKLIILVSIIVSIISCRKESSDLMKDLPICIQNLIDSGKEGTIKTIRTQTINGIVHYWLNNEASTWDGIEYIVDKDCNKVCYIIGECFPPKCLENYTNSRWKEIWKG